MNHFKKLYKNLNFICISFVLFDIVISMKEDSTIRPRVKRISRTQDYYRIQEEKQYVDINYTSHPYVLLSILVVSIIIFPALVVLDLVQVLIHPTLLPSYAWVIIILSSTVFSFIWVILFIK